MRGMDGTSTGMEEPYGGQWHYPVQSRKVAVRVSPSGTYFFLLSAGKNQMTK